MRGLRIERYRQCSDLRVDRKGLNLWLDINGPGLCIVQASATGGFCEESLCVKADLLQNAGYQTSEEEHQHAFLCSNIQHSTFHHQPTAGGPPFSPERETCCMLPFLKNFSILSFYEKIFRFTPANPMIRTAHKLLS